MIVIFFYEIETERLLLKNISYEDRQFILQQFSNEAVNKFLFDAEPLNNLKEADELIEFYLEEEPRLQHRWILSLKNSGKKLGTCGFHCWNRNKKYVDIGYDLKEEYWGQGIMTEALKAILMFAKNEMDVKKINANIYFENERSIRIAKKLGFVFSNETEVCVFRGKEYLHNIYTLEY